VGLREPLVRRRLLRAGLALATSSLVAGRGLLPPVLEQATEVVR
jgi:hypothetical protein